MVQLIYGFLLIIHNQFYRNGHAIYTIVGDVCLIICLIVFIDSFIMQSNAYKVTLEKSYIF